MDTDLESFRDIPGYKAILKAVLKSQIQHLVEQLSSETDEESIILTASISDGTLSHLGSVSGKSFINGNEEIKSQFLGFCLKEHHAKEQRRESPRADQSKPIGNSSLSSAAMMSEQYGRNVKPMQKTLMSRSGKRKGPYSRVRPDRIVGSPSDTGGGDKSGTIKIEPIDTEFDRVNVDSNRETQSTGAGSEFYEDNVGTVATDDREDNQHETNVRTNQDFNTQSTSPEPGTSGYKVEFSDPDTDFNISGFDLGDSVGSPEKWKQESANLNITDEAGTSADVDHSMDGKQMFLRYSTKRLVSTKPLKTKYEAITAIENKQKTRTDIMKELNISSSTLSTWLKNREKIKRGVVNFPSWRRSMKPGQYQEIDEEMAKWYRDLAGKGIHVTGAMLQEAAANLASELHVQDFKATLGWVCSFKNRHGFSGRKKKPDFPM